MTYILKYQNYTHQEKVYKVFYNRKSASHALRLFKKHLYMAWILPIDKR